MKLVYLIKWIDYKGGSLWRLIECYACFRERILKLEAENEHLRSSSAENEKIRLMKDEVDSLKAQIAEMETEVRLCNLQNVELKAK